MDQHRERTWTEGRTARGGPLVIVFGQSQTPGEPLDHANLFERIAQNRGRPFGHILLQDRGRAGFYRGATGLGDSIETTSSALQSMIVEFAPSEVITFGEGVGGHAALVFGVLLGASRIVALEPPAHLIADELQRYHDRRWQHELNELPDLITARKYDVPRLIEDRGFNGRAYILFGTQPGNDHYDAVHLNTIHAHRLALADQVTLCPFPDIQQGVLKGLVAHGDVTNVLSHYLFEDVEPLPHTRQSTRPDAEKLNKITTKLYRPFELHTINTLNPENHETQVISYTVVGPNHVKPVHRVDDEWRCWIAENLILGASAVELEDVLIARGISENEASLEISRAIQSPYFWGTQRLRNRLKKRDWLLASYRKLQRLRPESGTIERQHQLTRGDWLERYFSTNRPVIITGMMEDWPALRSWSLDSFSERFGDRHIEVELGRDLGDDRELARPAKRQHMPMVDYLAMLRQGDRADGSVLSADVGSSNMTALAELRNDIGAIPEYLDPCESNSVSFRLGGVGAIIPPQRNPVNRFLAQVLGQTQITFAHSWDLPLIQDHKGRFVQPDGTSRPPASSLSSDEPQIHDVLLVPGEILFLPVGAWFQCEGLGISATVMFDHLPFHNAFDAAPEDLER
ncbi:cupin-like domain-containing protein [Singulisphaera sp. Ch08]|uniref:Cupin-like domain-containing protein n=1 Tax=Singulisphaera sp. Ch08 TaxID=3120278 RepID=A0AAU7CKC3_9BACT